MHVVVIGISHLSAPLSLREKISPSIATLQSIPLFDTPHLILSTCNRCEIYLAAHDVADAHQRFIGYLREQIGLKALGLLFEEHLYTLFDFDAFEHLTRVSCGFESARVFETEIQGQVRAAYEAVRKVAPKAIHLYFQLALKISKRIRTQFQPTLIPPSLATLVQCELERHFGSLASTRGLVVGLSAINKPLLQRLSKHAKVTICNRTDAKAFEYAQRVNAAYIPWTQLPCGLQEHDWVVSAVATPHYIITPQMVEKSSALQFCIDLGVPRNIDPSMNTPSSKVVHLDELTQKIAHHSADYVEAHRTTAFMIERAWNRITSKM